MSHSTVMRPYLSSKKSRYYSRIEPLESRIAPAVTASLAAGVLTVTLGSGSDSATISGTDATGHNLAVAGTGLSLTSFTSVTKVIVNYTANSESVFATDTFGTFNLTGGFNVGSSSGVTGESFTDMTGGNAFDFSNFVGTGTLNGSATTPTTLNISKNASFTLTNLLVGDSADSMQLSLTNIATANLTDAGGGHSFTVSGWTGGGTMKNSGATTDTVVASKAMGTSSLVDTGLLTGDGMNIGLTGVKVANLTDNAGNAVFNLSGWTGTGSLTNSSAGADAVQSNTDGDYTLTNTNLSRTGSPAMSMTLSNIGIAILKTATGGHSFTISGWTHSADLQAISGTDTVIASKSGDYTLTNSKLTSTDGLSANLTNIGTANLTDTGGGHTFDVGGWTGAGTLTNSGSSADTVAAVKNASFTLTNTSLVSTDGMSLTLSTIATANLTDSGGSHSFDVGGWTGKGTLTNSGATADTVTATKNASYALANGSLMSSDGMSLTLSNIVKANLTDTGGGHNFTVTDWTGSGTLTKSGAGVTDGLTATKNSDFTLTNSSLVSSDGMSVTLSGITVASLTGGAGNNGFTVSGWTGTGSLTGGGGADTVTASKDVSYTLKNGSLQSTDGMSLSLSAIGTANLTGGVSANDFDVSMWTGSGTLTGGGGGSDRVVATKNASYTLSNSAISSTDGMSLTLSSIQSVLLFDTGGGHSFTVDGWTGLGGLSKTGPGPADTVNATKNAAFTIGSSALSSTDGMNLVLTLGSLAMVNLTDTGGNHSFTVSGWTGGGTLTSTGAMADTVTASKNAGYTLTNTSLTSTDGMSLTLSNIAAPNLTDTGGNHSFTVSGWTGGGTLTNTGPTADTVTASKNASYTLTNTSLTSTDGMSLTLSNIAAANLSDTGGNHSFTVSGWTGGGTLASTGVTADTVTASKNASYTLTNTSLTSTDGMSLTLSNIIAANLTDTGGSHSFTVSDWTGGGTLTNTGATADTVTASKNASFTLTNTSLTSTDGMSLTLSNIAVANLTDTGGSHNFTVSGWTGGGTLTNTVVAMADTVTASKNASFTLTNTSLASTDGMSLTLSNIKSAFLSDTGGGHSFNVDGWTRGGSIVNSGSGVDTVTASKSASFTLTDTSLTSTDGMALVLQNIGTANLTDTGGGDSFTVSGWSGGGSLKDTAAFIDTVIASKPSGFKLSDTSLTDGVMNLTLSNINTANLTDTVGGNTFDVTGWSGGGTLASPASPDTISVVQIGAGDYALSDSSFSEVGGIHVNLSGINKIMFVNGLGSVGSFDVSGWTGTGLIVGIATINATKNAGFSLVSPGLVGEQTLTDSADGMSLNMSAAQTYNLIDTGGGHAFSFDRFYATATVTNQAAGNPDTLSDSEDANFTLVAGSLTRDLGTPSVISFMYISAVNLTDTAGGHSFTVSGWTGGGSLTNSALTADTVIASKNANFTLSDTSLSSSDGMNLSLTNIKNAMLTDTGGSHSFTVSGWTGGGSLTNTGGTTDTVIASKNAGFTLSNSALSSTDGMSLTLSGIQAANLTDTGGGHTFDVGGWTGAGTFTDSGLSADAIAATKNASFTLTDSLLTSTDGLNLALSNITIANLTDTGTGHTFTVSGWTGSGTMAVTGGGSDSIVATKTGGFTLSNTSLTDTSDSMSLTLSAIKNAALTDSTGGHTFTVSGWTGSGSLTNSGSGGDTVVATKNASFTLTDGSLTSDDGMNLTLSGIVAADLTDTGTGHSFNVSGWTLGAALAVTGGGSDTVVATKAGGFTLTNDSLTDTADAMSLTLFSVDNADLTDSGSGHTFTVSGWTGGGSLTDSGGTNDVVAATKNADFVLSNSEITATDGLDLALTNIGSANLTGGASANRFDVSGWTKTGSLDGGGGTGDTVVASKNAGFELGDFALTATDGLNVNLSGIDTATLADTGGNHMFFVSSWTGGGSLTNTGGTTDTVLAMKSAGFTLSDTLLADSADGMNLALSGIEIASLTDAGPAGGNTFTVSGWTGSATFDNNGTASDTIVASKSANFILADSALSSSDGMIVLLSHFDTANLTDTGGGHSFTVSSWTGGGTLTYSGGAGAIDSVVAAKAGGFTLSDTALTDSADTMHLALSGIKTANLTDTASGDHTFTVSGWTGGGTLAGFAGAHDKVTSTKDFSSVLSDNLLYAKDGMNLALTNLPVAALTAGLGALVLDASHYSGTLTLTGSAATTGTNNDTLIAGLGVNTLIGGQQSDRFVLNGLSISDALTPSVMAAAGASGQRDLIDYSTATDGLTVNLSKVGISQQVNKTAALKTKGLLTLNGLFDDLIGSNFNDTLTGNSLSNIIFSGKGTDRLAGGGVPHRGIHDYLAGNRHTIFTAPAHGSGEIDSKYRGGISPFLAIPIIHTVPPAIIAIITASKPDPFISAT